MTSSSQLTLDVMVVLRVPNSFGVILGLRRLGVNLVGRVSINGSLSPAPAGFILVLGSKNEGDGGAIPVA